MRSELPLLWFSLALGCGPGAAHLSTEQPLTVVAQLDAVGSVRRAELHVESPVVELQIYADVDVPLVALSFGYDELEEVVHNVERSRASELTLEISAPPTTSELVTEATGTYARTAIPTTADSDALVLIDGEARFEPRPDVGARARGELTLKVPATPVGVCTQPPVVSMKPFVRAPLGAVNALRFGPDEVLAMDAGALTVLRRDVGTSTIVLADSVHRSPAGYSTWLDRMARDPMRSTEARTVAWLHAIECPVDPGCAEQMQGAGNSSAIQIELIPGMPPRVLGEVSFPTGRAELLVTAQGEPWLIARDGRSWSIAGDPPIATAGPRVPEVVYGVAVIGSLERPFVVGGVDRIFALRPAEARYELLFEADDNLFGTAFSAVSGQTLEAGPEVWTGGRLGRLYRWQDGQKTQLLPIPSPAAADACTPAGTIIPNVIRGVAAVGRWVLLAIEGCSVLVVYDTEQRCTFGVASEGGPTVTPLGLGPLDVVGGRWLTTTDESGAWQLDLRELDPG